MVAMQCGQTVQSKLTGVHLPMATPSVRLRPGMQQRCQRQTQLNLCLILLLLAAHLCAECFLTSVATRPQAISVSQTAAAATTRRSVLMLRLSPFLGSAVLAPVGSRADMRFDNELPPLPKSYRDIVVDLATATKNALLTTLKGNRDPGQRTQMQLEQEQAKVGMLVEKYEKNFVDSSSASKLDATLLEHPVYFAMKRAIGELQSGGGQTDDMQSFRLDLIREMNAILRLTEKAGVSPEKLEKLN